MSVRSVLAVLVGVASILVTGCGPPHQAQAPIDVDFASRQRQAAESEEPYPKVPADFDPRSLLSERPTDEEPVEEPPLPENVIASDNLLGNGSFEADVSRGLPYWRVPEGIEAIVDDTVAYDGVASLRVDIGGSVNLGIWQPVLGVEPGRRYLLRGYIKSEDVLGGMRFEVQDAERGFAAFRESTKPITGTQAWIPRQVTFAPPEGTVSIGIWLRRPIAEGAPDTPGVIWFDHLELFQVVPAVGPNLLANAGFGRGDNGLRGWGGVPEGATATKSLSGRTGPCVQIELSGNVNMGVRQGVDVTPGTRYSLTGYVKCQELVGEARLEVQDAERGWKHFLAYSRGITGTQDWTQLSLVFAAPEDVEKLDVFLRRPATEDMPTTLGTVWFDNYFLLPLSAPSGEE